MVTAQARKVLDEVLALPEDDRVGILDELAASLADRMVAARAAWDAEVARRLSAMDRGEIAVLDGTIATRELRAKYGR